MTEKNYFHTIAKDSLWNTTNVAVTGVSSFIFSILLARFLHPDTYGRYIFIITVINVAVMLFDFGISSALNKYVPKYLNDKENKKIAVNFFKKTTTFQFVVVLAVVLLGWFLRDRLKGYLPLNNGNYDLVFLFISLSVIFSVLSKQVVNYLSAAGGFRKVTLANIVVVLVNLVLIILFNFLGFGINQYLFIPAIINILLVTLLARNFNPYISYSKGDSVKSIDTKEVVTYSAISYINLIILYIIYSYSEVFFLNRFSEHKEVGFYTLAFMLSMIISTLPMLFHRPLFNAQYELLEKGEEDRSDNMTYFAVKFSSIIFIPVVILACYFMRDLVGLVYGSDYLKVATIFPFCILGSIISTILAPISLKVNNHNRLFGIATLLTIIGAALNIAIDIILIPKYGSIGAGIANFTSQLVVVITTLSYILRNVHVVIDWGIIIRIFFTNVFLALILFSTLLLSSNVVIKIFLVIPILSLYLSALKHLKILEARDSLFLDSLIILFPQLKYITLILNKFKLSRS